MKDRASPTDDVLALAPLEELARMGYALAMQLLNHREDAADAVQDSLHRLVEKRASFDWRRGQVRAWFLKILRNRCVDLLRRRSRRRCKTLDDCEIAAPAEERPEAAAARHETLELLKHALMTMPQQQREIILLRDFHDLSYAEIAKVLSIPMGTVMSRLHRARLELKKRFEQATVPAN